MLLPGQSMSFIVSVAGLVCLLLALLRRAPWGSSLGMMLDLWTAAVLLRLSPEDTSWRALIVAALMVVLRHLVMWSVRTGPWGRWPRARPRLPTAFRQMGLPRGMGAGSGDGAGR